MKLKKIEFVGIEEYRGTILLGLPKYFYLRNDCLLIKIYSSYKNIKIVSVTVLIKSFVIVLQVNGLLLLIE